VSRAYRLVAPGRAEIVELPRPEPGPAEVLLRVLAAGVCRTDVALLNSGGDGLTLPVTLGHEIVGEVVTLGSAVSAPERGDVVAVYELLGCGRCGACARGDDNVCREVIPGAIGITRDGGMADHVVVPARNLVPIGSVEPVHAAPLTDGSRSCTRSAGPGTTSRARCHSPRPAWSARTSRSTSSAPPAGCWPISRPAPCSGAASWCRERQLGARRFRRLNAS
jgi:D-arabinose 1-dehydrogenase-like Zn-dependent alcohol dehydrogenase